MGRCPFCTEEIEEAAVMCNSCGKSLRTNEPSLSQRVHLTSVSQPLTRFSLGICAAIVALLFILMAAGGFSENEILKVIGRIGAGITLFLIVPFSWWLQGVFRR